MKMAFLILWMLAVPVITGCDDRGQNLPTDEDIVGNYVMTEWNAPENLDLNGDGQASRNLMNENGCYYDSELVINDDHTFILVYNTTMVSDGVLVCHEQLHSGTWTRSGNRIISIGTDNVQRDFSFYASEGIIRWWMEDVNYPKFDHSGQMIHATGNAHAVFIR